jgi:hypothetical protein
MLLCSQVILAQFLTIIWKRAQRWLNVESELLRSGVITEALVYIVQAPGACYLGLQDHNLEASLHVNLYK